MMEGRNMEPTDRDRIEAGWATRMGVFPKDLATKLDEFPENTPFKDLPPDVAEEGQAYIFGYMISAAAERMNILKAINTFDKLLPDADLGQMSIPQAVSALKQKRNERDADHKDQIKKRKSVSSAQSGLDRKVAQQQREIDELKAKLDAERQRADKAERERDELRDAILKAE